MIIVKRFPEGACDVHSGVGHSAITFWEYDNSLFDKLWRASAGFFEITNTIKEINFPWSAGEVMHFMKTKRIEK